MKKDPLKIIGIIIIIIGAISLFSAFPFVTASIFPGAEELAKKVPPISATRIMIGVISIILGLIVYFGKEGLKILAGK